MTEPGGGLASLIRQLESRFDSLAGFLPEEIFLFVSRITPLVNVDLLIQDHARGTLLTWRHDRFYGPGWHVPGGIIRFRETAADRIHTVAKSELGAAVQFEPTPLFVHENINLERRDRGHAISLLYRCHVTSELDEQRRFLSGEPLPHQWYWHRKCPDNLIHEQQSYAAFME